MLTNPFFHNIFCNNSKKDSKCDCKCSNSSKQKGSTGDLSGEESTDNESDNEDDKKKPKPKPKQEKPKMDNLELIFVYELVRNGARGPISEKNSLFSLTTPKSNSFTFNHIY